MLNIVNCIFHNFYESRRGYVLLKLTQRVKDYLVM